MNKLYKITIGIILVIAVIYFGGQNLTTSSGSRNGIIVKFTQKGNIIKSFEGSLQFEGSTHFWDFSVEDSAMAAIVEKAYRERQPVFIDYKQTLIKSYNTDTPYTVTKVTTAVKP